MKKFYTLIFSLALASVSAVAGDGTKSNPFTVSELNAQKETLAVSGDTVWVIADLKGLGEDGSLEENTENNCAGLFVDSSDETTNFVAYSYQILGELAITDLTNTQNLLIALTYQKGAHLYGNKEYSDYASNNGEPEDELHFSLVEVHNALSLKISNGFRGFHIASCFVVPKDVIAVKVYAGYNASKGAYVNYTNYSGNDEQEHATPKNWACVFMAEDGVYDFVLTTKYYEQAMSNSNALNGGTQEGVNAGTKKNRWRLRFVSDGTKVGFERNSDENSTVTLASKDEIYLEVNSLNFVANWEWETEAKDWISWQGGSYSDLATPVQNIISTVENDDATIYDLQGRRVAGTPTKGVYVRGGKLFIVK